ncbi:hypothetical protein QZH41_002407 [Actinostola sp. cb2023]|nr:hypothetical protein QZH41_002407 [Actinostola sp. cb2023]
MADEMEFDEDLLFSEFEAVDDRPADFSSYREKNTEDPPSMDLKALKEENCQLKQLLKRLLVPETCKHGATTDIEKPFFHAVFFNNQASTEGRQKLELFLHTLATIKPDSVNGHDSSLEQSFSFSSLQPSVCPLNAFVNDVDAESETSRKDSVDLSNDSPFSVINCAQYFEFYCIDPCGFPLVSYTSTSEAEGWEVPVYDQIFFTAITCNEDSSKVKVKRKRACFNCGNVGHNLISRYHVDEKKFGAFKPGVASSALREALGIRSDEVPHYIYKMRLLGYPPGYIPSTSNSTLVIYNADGNVEDYVMEDVDEEDEEDDEKIKKSIFVEYPGFNCPLPKDIRDRSRELGYPPMSPQQSIWYWQYKETIQIPNNGSRDPRCTNKRGWTEANDGAGDMELDVEGYPSTGVYCRGG